MPEMESNATKSRLEKFIDGCSQLTEIYAVTPLDYTNIMGEWWQRINDIIYTLGLTETQNTPVTIAWTVPVPGRKRSPFFEEEIATKKPDGTTVLEASRVSHVAGDGTGQQKAHKYGFIQSVDKLFQRNINTWGNLYNYFYNQTDESKSPIDLTEMVFGKKNLNDTEITRIFESACRNLTGDNQGLANSVKHVIEDVIGSNLYDLLDPNKQGSTGGNSEPKGLIELLFGTDARGNPLSVDAIKAKWNQMERGENQKEGLIGRSNDIVDTIGQDLFDWMSAGTTKCEFEYGTTTNSAGPHTLQEVLFGKWDKNGPVDSETNSSTGPSWCQIVSNLKSSGILTEVYNITNYLGDGYQNYVDLQNKIKEPDNPNIPKVNQEEVVKEDPIQTLKNIGVGQVLYGTKDTENKLNFENDWIFKSANICTSPNEVQSIVEYAADQQKIFEDFKRVSWSSVGDNPNTDGYVYPKVTVKDDNTILVDGLQKAYVSYSKVTIDDAEELVSTIKLMPLPEVECTRYLGEMPGITANGNENLRPSGACSVGDYWFIVKDGTYAGHFCKKGEFLLCIAAGNSEQACWKVMNDSAYRLQAFNSNRTCPPFTRFNKIRQIGYLYPPGTQNLTGNNYTAIQAPYTIGDCYKVVKAGNYSGRVCNANDVLYCNTSGGENGTVTGGHWTRINRMYVAYKSDGSIEDWYNWNPTTQTITRSDNPDIFDFWKNYNGPYEAFGNTIAFLDHKSFDTATDISWVSDTEKKSSKWNPKRSPINIKGRLGLQGTYASLPASHTVGDAYVVEAPGTYAGEKCYLYDTVICTKSGTVAKDSDWKVVHKLIYRNHGWHRMNRVISQYGVPNINSSTYQILKDTCRTETIKVGDSNETYFTVTAVSNSSDSNWPRLNGRLLSKVINKEEITHRGVSGNESSGYTINDDGNIYSFIQFEIPYGLYQSDGTVDGRRQYWYGYTLTWQCPRYKTEKLALTRTMLGTDDNSPTRYPINSPTSVYWLICKGTLSGMDITLGDPIGVIVNGVYIPCVKQGGIWGIKEEGNFYPLTRYADSHAYARAVYYVETSTQDSISYVGMDSNNNEQFTFNGSATAQLAKSKFEAGRFNRIEKREMTTSVKRAIKLIGTTSAIETITTTTAGMSGLKYILTSGATGLDPNSFSNWDNPESSNWPFQTANWGYGYGTGDKKWSVVEAPTYETVEEYGGWGATSQYTTVTNNWSKPNDTWIKTSSSSTTTYNRPLRTTYFWDFEYFMKYQWWNGTTRQYNEGDYRFKKYHSYNVPDLTYKTPEYLTSSMGLSVNGWSNACPWESRSWKYDTGTNSVKIGVNSISFLALTSNKKYSEYRFDCVPASHTDDDDNLGIVVAGTNNYQTGMYNAITFDRWSVGCALRINNTLTLWSISNSPLFRILNGQYCRATTMYADSVYRPIIYTDEGATWDNTASNSNGFNRYHLSTFTIGNQKYVNKAEFWMKPTYITEGPSGNGTKDDTMTGRTNADGSDVVGTTEHVKMTVQTIMDHIKPNSDGSLSYLAYKRVWNNPDINKIKNASPCNNVYGMWLAPFHLSSVSADVYWNLLPVDAQNDTISTIKALVKKIAANGTEIDITDNNEAVSIFKNAIYPKFVISTYNVDDFTLDDMIKVYHNCAAGGTFPVSGVSNLNINSIGVGDRWVISGFGWLNVFTGLDMNYRVIVQRKYNPASACYEITMRYKDICHRLDGSNGKYKKTFSNGQTKIVSNDPGFIYFTDNQTYKGDILITIVKNGYDASGNMIVDNAYNITVWQEKNGAKTLISYIRLTTDSILTTRTYALDDYGHNILTPNTEANETDAYGKVFTETVNVNETRPIKKLNSSTGTSNQSGQSAWKKLDNIMTNIASYGYINCSTPLSEYKNIKFVDLISGEIYDIENNTIYRVDTSTNDYYKDTNTNLSATQEIMSKYGVGRFLYNDITNRLFFARGDTDSIQAIT